MASEEFLKQLESMKAVKPTAVPPTTQPTPTITSTPATQPAPTQPKQKFLQGSWWDKTMDVLNTPMYALAGFSKGLRDEQMRQRRESGNYSEEIDMFSKPQKLASLPQIGSRIVSGVKNIIPGVRNRQMYGNEPGDLNVGKDLGIKNPTAQAVVNTGISFASPSLPIAKIPGVKQAAGLVGKAVGKVTDLARKSDAIAGVVEKVNPFFKTPEVGKMVAAAEETINLRQNQLANFIRKSVGELTPAEQSRVGQILEGGISISEKDNKYAQIAKPISEFADSVGKEAVDLGLLSPESYQNYKGKYMTHIWTSMLEDMGIGTSNKSGVFPKISGQFFKERKGAEGYVRQFAPAVFKGLGTEIKDIETAKLYKQIAEKYGGNAQKLIKNENMPTQLVRSLAKRGSDVVKDIPVDRGERIIKEGFSYAPKAVTDTKAGRLLKDIQLPNEVVEAINKTVNTGESEFAKGMSALLNTWKAGKTFWNPAYHVRNLISNQILADMSTGKGLANTVYDFARSAKSYLGKDADQFVQAAENAGLIKNGNFGNTLDEFAKTAGLVKTTNPNILSKYNNFTKSLQNSSEEIAKVSVFRSWIEKLADDAGKTVQEALSDNGLVKQAVNKAQEAIFSPGKISRQERKLASTIVPFYSFTRQAVPFTAKTLANNPERITKYEKIKKGVENLSPEGAVNNENLPEYRKNQIRTPFKDKDGNYSYFDPKYLYPFGNFDESTSGLPFGLSLNPIVTEVAQQQANKDFYFDQEIAKSNIPEKAMQQRVEHATRTFAPQLYTTIKSKLIPAFTGQLDYAGRDRSKIQAILDAFGIKSSVFRPEEQAKFDRLDKNSKLKSIRSEMLKYRNDKSISNEDRKTLLDELSKIYTKTLGE